MSFKKSFRKINKTTENQGFVESNELIKKDFNIDRDRIPLEEQKIIFNELVIGISSEFINL